MGGFARVALPVAMAIAAPYAMAALGPATASQLGVMAVQGGMSNVVIPVAFPWASAALAGVGALAGEQQRNQQLKYQNQLRNNQIAQQQQVLAVQEKQRRDRLRKAIASERARFGAMGMNSRGGSAAALIRGLTKSVEKDINFGRQSFNLKRRSLLEESAPAKRSGFSLVQRSLSPFVNILEAA